MLGSGTLMFEEGEWSICAESPPRPGRSYKSGRRVDSYIYHKPCGGAESDSNGWCSAWDVREGCCYYCKQQIPESVKTVWLLLEGEKLGSYMTNKSEPWKPVPGRQA